MLVYSKHGTMLEKYKEANDQDILYYGEKFPNKYLKD